MAACGSLQHMFENPLPESPTKLVESPYSWNQFKSVKPIQQPSSFTEIFGELHFKDNSSSSVSSCLTDLEPIINIQEEKHKKNPSSSSSSSSSSISMEDSFSSLTEAKYGITCRRNSSHDSFSSLMNSESLQLCTEGLGFESSGEVEEDMTTTDKDKDKDKDDDGDDCQLQNQQHKLTTTSKGHHLPFQNSNLCGELRRRSSRSNTNINGSSSLSSSSSGSSGNGTGTFPPPISCISKNGKPWVCFKSYRHDGRFVLKQITIPTQEFLHACREDGRLKLHFVHPHHHHRDGVLDDRDQQYGHEDDEEEGGDYDDDDDDDDEDDHQENGKEEDNIDEAHHLVPIRS